MLMKCRKSKQFFNCFCIPVLKNLEVMDELFDHRSFLKKDADPQKIQEYLELPSGSEEDFSNFSDEDPTFNPDELEAYTSSDDEDCESALP
ncbi:hypothetical protein AVEN_225318-1 [Araneus ventricosus]|uniref:Uncharacterized protein n=1 Tax=Araneus ventricosus TaxID=182803 RepID=A0A4Y2ALD3_ARAVE|nr:hypothetical protein AVEN_225318-1 [Araneus ventricosus]